MSAKKLIVVALISSLLSACGGNSGYTPTLPDDGTYTGGTGTDDYSSGYDPGTSGGYDQPGSGATEPGASEGYLLKGTVLDKETNKPLAGAKVSIGSSTQLTGADGTFEFAGIRDSQIWLTIKMDGYKGVDRANVTFSQEKPAANKEVLLAPTGSSGDSSGGDDDSGSDNDGAKKNGFGLEATFGEGKFKSTHAMVVADDVAYVLGVVDGPLWFNHNSVVAFDLESGEELVTFNKTGMLSRLPKDADSLKVEDGQVTVSNGEDSFVFSASGDFVKKTSGARFSLVKEVTDEERDLTFTVKSGTKIEVSHDGDAETFTLDEVGTIRSIGLDSEGGLVVLDTSDNTVRRYSFEL